MRSNDFRLPFAHRGSLVAIHFVGWYCMVTRANAPEEFGESAVLGLGYRDLVLADVTPPIVVIVPDRFALDEGYSRAVKVAADMDTLLHAGRIFNRSFETLEEITAYVDQLGEASQVVRAMSDPTRLVFDGEWNEPLADQLQRYASAHGVDATRGFGNAVFNCIYGRMLMSNNSLLGSSLLGGSPSIDAPASWKYLQWKYEYDAAAGHAQQSTSNVLVSKGLESELLAGLPPETLLELRRQGAAAELREVIGKGIDEISTASDSDIARISDVVIANIDAAFTTHNAQLQALVHSQTKFFGLDVGRFVVNCGFGLASIITGTPALAAMAFISQIAGSPMPDDLLKRYKELRQHSDKLRRSPIGIMFRQFGSKFGFS